MSLPTVLSASTRDESAVFLLLVDSISSEVPSSTSKPEISTGFSSVEWFDFLDAQLVCLETTLGCCTPSCLFSASCNCCLNLLISCLERSNCASISHMF